MSEPLRSLARRERDLFSRVQAVTGDMGEQMRRLEAHGVFAEYSTVFAECVALLDEADSADEALQRAVLLLWYAQVEPGCFSGLRPLPQSGVDRALRELDRRIGLGTLPPDLEWQLPYYHMVAEWVFNQAPGLDHLVMWLRSGDDAAWLTRIRERTFGDHGALSDYWASLIPAPAP